MINALDTATESEGDHRGDRRDFVEAAPTLPGDPWLRLPPASPRRYDGEATVVFHLRPNKQRLVAH